jgi:hypothetical protein
LAGELLAAGAGFVADVVGVEVVFGLGCTTGLVLPAATWPEALVGVAEGVTLL